MSHSPNLTYQNCVKPPNAQEQQHTEVQFELIISLISSQTTKCQQNTILKLLNRHTTDYSQTAQRTARHFNNP